MVQYGITLVLLYEKLWDTNPEILNHFYADDTTFDGSSQSSTRLMRILLDHGPDQG